eukprot:scaffold991_cov278-Amphora_coffeaeformis.AAC.3
MGVVGNFDIELHQGLQQYTKIFIGRPRRGRCHQGRSSPSVSHDGGVVWTRSIDNLLFGPQGLRGGI